MTTDLHIATSDDLHRTSDGARTYTAPEMCALTGATYRQIDFWARLGYLTDNAQGSGSQRRFVERDVEVMHAVIGLTGVGVNVRAAFEMVNDLIDTGTWTRQFRDIYEITIRVRTDPKEHTE